MSLNTTPKYQINLIDPTTGVTMQKDLLLPTVPRSGDVILVRVDDKHIKMYMAGSAAMHADPEAQKVDLWYPHITIQASFVRREFSPIDPEEKAKLDELKKERG